MCGNLEELFSFQPTAFMPDKRTKGRALRPFFL